MDTPIFINEESKIDFLSLQGLLDLSFDDVHARNGTNNNYTDDILAFWDYDLMVLTKSQRIIFLCVVAMLLGYSILGNSLTIYANLTRKIRPVFRVCLLSLAFSDLMISISTSTTYISQFSIEMTLLWVLGDMLCGFIPFISTMAILINSFTLVGIAFDRYISIKKYIKGSWDPSIIFCLTCITFIWGLAAGIASPMMTSYFQIDVFVLISNPNNRSNATSFEIDQMCIGEKSENAYYFGIVFAIVFLPLLGAFFWLNIVIAKQIYDRRNPKDYQSQNTNSQSEFTSSEKRTSETNTSENKLNKTNSLSISQTVATPPTKCNPKGHKAQNNARKKRKIRQLRMFIVILVIIGLFFLLRLPTWIYLLIKLNVILTDNIHWVLHYTFGILSLTNCVINPFLYTFLSETIIYGSIMTNSIRNCCCKFGKCCHMKSETDSRSVSEIEIVKPVNVYDGGVYVGERRIN